VCVVVGGGRGVSYNVHTHFYSMWDFYTDNHTPPHHEAVDEVQTQLLCVAFTDLQRSVCVCVGGGVLHTRVMSDRSTNNCTSLRCGFMKARRKELLHVLHRPVAGWGGVGVSHARVMSNRSLATALRCGLRV
jgi:hypothetical protein